MALVALIVGEGLLAWAFVPVFLAVLAINFALTLCIKTQTVSFSTGETLATVALAWAVIMLLGAIPFWICSLLSEETAVRVFQHPLNGLFESVSGFTSTGLTMVNQPSKLPLTLQFWRSFMEWIGGVGLALLMLAVLNPKSDSGDIFDSELNKPFRDSFRKTAKQIWWIYIALTGIGMLLFAGLGMPLWESLNHGMTAIATGGFSVTDDSFGAYSIDLQIVAMFLMAMGAISFATYHEVLQKRHFREFFRYGPTRFLFAGIIIASLLLWLSRLEIESDDGYFALLFQVTSAFGTAGFTTVSLSDWNSTSLAILIVCMLIGGAGGATTGGVKIDRILLLCRGIGWRFERLFGKKTRSQILINDEVYDSQAARLQVESAATLVSLWIITVLTGCLVLVSVCGEEWSFTPGWV